MITAHTTRLDGAFVAPALCYAEGVKSLNGNLSTAAGVVPSRT